MFDFSTVDPRLLFPSLTESWAVAINSAISILDFIGLVLMIVAEWNLFKKFGEKSWKSLVPYYNTYILYKHSWSKKACLIYLISSSLFDIAQIASKQWAQNDPASMWSSLFVLFGLPFGIVAAVCSILYAFRLAEAFGKGKAFSAGLLLLYPVFISIIGLGKVQYLGNCEDESLTDVAESPIDGGVV